MCQRVQVEYPNRKILCKTIGDLVAAVGRDLQFFPGYAEVIQDDYCLCPVDLERTARALGYSPVTAGNAKASDLLPGDVVFRPDADTAAQRGTSLRRTRKWKSPRYDSAQT